MKSKNLVPYRFASESQLRNAGRTVLCAPGLALLRAGGCVPSVAKHAGIGAIAFLLFTLLALADGPKNFFSNPSFEMGRDGWQLEQAGKTECRFSVDDKDAADGRNAALLTIESVEDWGLQFGQTFPAGVKGKTYTFAVSAKSLKGPVKVGLQIERRAEPYDRAANQEFTLTSEWQELHVTFKVETNFPQGWFAYLSCDQSNAQFRADMFRLYEGEYAPYKEIAQQQIAEAAVHIFDTGKPSASPLAPEALSGKTGWREVPEDNVSSPFKGDAVFINDRIALVLRRGGQGAEVYTLGPGRPAMRTLLTPVAGKEKASLSSFTLVENSPSAGAADAVFKTAGGQALTLRYGLKAGQPVVQTEASSPVTSLRVEAPCRFVVMPDFFSDDIVIDATELQVARAELPSDNLLLHLLPGGEAMVMSVVKTSEEDISIAMSGEGENRMITSSELRYGKDGKAWVAVLASPALWHMQPITREQAGQVLPLTWKAPFPAQWRTDWRRDEGVTDSWVMAVERPNGRFTKQVLFGEPDRLPVSRKRWNTVLGDFKYPCWLDKSGQGWLQPIKNPALRFNGPAIIYPINRAPDTALDTFTVVDIVRNTLGVGPCQYILDVEGQQAQYKGMATCEAHDTLNGIYSKNQQKQRRVEVEEVLRDVMLFIRHIRGRIESYVAFEHEILAYLAEQQKAHPELAAPLTEMEKLARVIEAKFAARKNEIKTPDDAAKLVEEFRQTVLDYEGTNALAKCQYFTDAWVGIGGNQDELAGECRWATKMLRQKSGLLMATDPGVADIAREVRRRSQLVLRNPANHESAVH